LLGGAHENERRAGTENLAAIQGLVAAVELFLKTPVFPKVQMRRLTRRLRVAIQQLPGCEIVSPEEDCLSNTVSFVVPGADSITLLAGLDVAGICASSGSACSAGSLEPSHVIVALGKASAANGLVRFSLGRDSTDEEIDQVLIALPKVIRQAEPGGLGANGE